MTEMSTILNQRPLRCQVHQKVFPTLVMGFIASAINPKQESVKLKVVNEAKRGTKVTHGERHEKLVHSIRSQLRAHVGLFIGEINGVITLPQIPLTNYLIR
jgi:hypothetical protein